ncbi:M3 family metallopeptidase [Fictibacillus sp. KIGAM418]|uniref:M3 family metallopeptidase n=1 Tax=Fictibacillus marinisediminis TaxID=2878389 RepID=A0A9X2BHL8_9BACL|nr:M2 family metallopeptidase [Fictibacillus marinisediminis]MCK6259422.1 M3 family metallopeptidase [Fictibacillus marinisediminis]
MELQRLNMEMKQKYERMMDSLWHLLVTGNPDLIEAADQTEKAYQTLLLSQEVQQLIKSKTKERSNNTSLEHMQINMLRNETLEFSYDLTLREQMNELWSGLNFHFATFRPTIDGQTFTESELLGELENQPDPNERKKYWEAYMKSGQEIEDQLLTLVKKRNQVAREKGYSNFYELKLSTQDLNVKDVKETIYHIKSSLDPIYEYLKQMIDEEIMEKFNISSQEIQPWHYQHPFFQYYKNNHINCSIDMLDIKDFFEKINLDIAPLIQNGNFTNDQEKSPTGFCFHVDRQGDIRISVNQNPTFQSIQTLLHELGHGAYEMSMNPSLPFLLKQPSQIFISEAIALLFEKIPLYSIHFPSKDASEVLAKETYYQNLLVRLYWTMTLTLFEMQLYENPEQNLNELWWTLVKDIQKVNPPEDWDFPYWASKSHLSSLPVYYHNYLFGELIASTLFIYLKSSFKEPFSPDAIQDLKEHLFYPGASLRWKDASNADFFLPITSQYLKDEIKAYFKTKSD